MNVNLQNTMGAGMTFVLVSGVLVVLAATIGDVFCRITDWGSTGGGLAYAGTPSYGGDTSDAGEGTAVATELCPAPGSSKTLICEENGN